VGKKLAKFKTTKPPLKGRKNKRRGHKESDWRDYWGSSDHLVADVERLGQNAFTREILYMCKSRGEMSYLEAREQFERRVLETDEYYNGIINVRVGGSNILKQRLAEQSKNSNKWKFWPCVVPDINTHARQKVKHTKASTANRQHWSTNKAIYVKCGGTFETVLLRSDLGRQQAKWWWLCEKVTTIAHRTRIKCVTRVPLRDEAKVGGTEQPPPCCKAILDLIDCYNSDETVRTTSARQRARYDHLI